METLAFIVAAFLDPLQAGIVLAVLCLYHRSMPILVAALVAVVASETIMAFAGPGYMWGELIAPRLLAALLQASTLFWVVRFILHRRVHRDAEQPSSQKHRMTAAASR
jgi:hypothetical protein